MPDTWIKGQIQNCCKGLYFTSNFYACSCASHTRIQVSLEYKITLFFLMESRWLEKERFLGILQYKSTSVQQWCYHGNLSTEFQSKQGAIKSHTFRDLASKNILSLIKWPLHFESIYKNCKESLTPLLGRMNFVCASDNRIINRVLNIIKIRRLIED